MEQEDYTNLEKEFVHGQPEKITSIHYHRCPSRPLTHPFAIKTCVLVRVCVSVRIRNSNLAQTTSDTEGGNLLAFVIKPQREDRDNWNRSVQCHQHCFHLLPLFLLVYHIILLCPVLLQDHLWQHWASSIFLFHHREEVELSFLWCLGKEHRCGLAAVGHCGWVGYHQGTWKLLRRPHVSNLGNTFFRRSRGGVFGRRFYVFSN